MIIYIQSPRREVLNKKVSGAGSSVGTKRIFLFKTSRCRTYLTLVLLNNFILLSFTTFFELQQTSILTPLLLFVIVYHFHLSFLLFHYLVLLLYLVLFLLHLFYFYLVYNIHLWLSLDHFHQINDIKFE